MAPKKAPVDKAAQAQKTKIAEDKTFGMKNKNKSKVVQKYIKSIHQNATGACNRNEQAERKEKADGAEAAKKKALMASLFNLQTDKKGKAFDPVAKKKAQAAEEEAIAAGKKLNDEIKKQIIEGIANTIRLTNPKTGIRMSELGGHPIIAALKDKHADTFRTIQLLLFIKGHDRVFWCDDPESSNPTIRCQEDVDAEVAPDERSLEEILEEKRRNLVGPGTPITEVTFKEWKAKKDEERKNQVEADKSKVAQKAGNKLAAMSGRDLFTYDASLFVDDEGAADDDDLKDREDCLDSEEEREDSDEEDEPAAEAVNEGGAAAAGSAEEAGQASGNVAINKDLFLQEADDLDDLDDLDDEEEGAEEAPK